MSIAIASLRAIQALNGAVVAGMASASKPPVPSVDVLVLRIQVRSFAVAVASSFSLITIMR